MNFSLPPMTFGAAPAATTATAAAAAPAAGAAAPPATAAPAAAAPAAAAPAAAPAAAAAPVTAVVPAGPAISVESRFDSYASLLECVQDAWTGAAEVDTIRTVIIQHMDAMAQVAESKPSAKSRAVIVGKNIELDGSKVNLSDERTVQFVLELSNMLQVNELDALRLVFLAAASLSASDPAFGRGSAADVQWALRVRATELYFQRRFNLLLSTLDLVLMEREGGVGAADSGSAHVQRVVGESVAELVRLGITSNVMNCIESLSQEPAAPAAAAGSATAAAPAAGATPASGTPGAAAPAPLPDIRAYRALELSYLLRLLFALFKPSGCSTAAGDNLVASSDVGSEDLVRLVEHIQRRSAALTAAQTAATAKQAQITAQQEILAKQQQHALLYGGQFGAAGLNAPTAAAGAAATSSAVDGPDHVSTFNCYVLLCTMMEGLEVKYRALATSISAGARAPASGGGSKAEKAAAAAAANAVANLFQVIIDLSRRLDSSSNWSNDVFRCGALLVWSLFLKRVKLLQPGAVSETDEEIQQMVLEGLGGSENQGFWIDLVQTLATNPAFAGLKKSACGVAGAEQDELLNATAAANNAAATAAAQSSATAAAVALSSSSPSSSSLLTDLSEVLGEFLAGVISLHGKEMDLLRREDKKVQLAHEKAVARYEKLVQQQTQQQQVQSMQMAHSYGGQFSGFNGTNAAAASAPIVVGEPPQPPQLNFQSFLSVLSSLLRSTPALESLLWATPGFDAFMGAELDARSSSSSANQPVNIGIGMPGHGASTPGGSLLSGSSGVNPGSFHTNSSSSNSIFTSDSPFLLSYIDLLSSLCHDASSSLRVYSFVRGCSRINWEMVCVHYMQQGLIAHYLPAAAQDDQANQQAMRRGQVGYGFGAAQQNAYRPPVPTIAPLTTKQLALLSSLLHLLSSLLRPSPALQSAFGLHSDFKLLDTAFGLLGLKLPVSVKAHVLEVISSLSRGNQDMALQVWERLERSQVLPTRHFAQAVASGHGAQGGYAGLRGAQVSAPSLLPSGAALEGLLFDLEEVENQMQIYPLTSAFLHLIVTLMESAPLPSSLGVGVRGVGTSSANQQLMQSAQSQPQQMQGVYGVAPYLSFIHAHVFLNLPHRAYARSMESFVLAELALAAFARVVGDFVRECGATSAEGTASFAARHESHSFSGFDSQAAQSPLQSLAMHPAYTLLRDILQGKEVLSQIILQLHSAYSLLENEGQLASPSAVGVVHPAVEGTLLQATRLLWIILEQEELVVDVMQRIEEVVNGGSAATQGFGGLHGRLSPLSGLLLQHQPCVVTLAKCVGFIQNHTDTSVQQLLREKIARDKAKQKAASANGLGSVSSAAAALNQQMPNLSSMADQSQLNQSSMMFEQEAVEDDPMMAAANAAAAASSTALALEAADDGRTSEIAFYAASAMLLLSQRDESRLVHIVEAARLSSHVVAAFRRQIKYVQLPSSESEENADPDLTCNKARLVILDLLLSSLQTPSPATPHISLALLLLGFDLSTPGSVRATELARSPTSALLETLLFDLALKPGFARRFPSLAQSVYQMLFKLLSAPLTSAATLRWIKTHPTSGGAGAAGYLLTLLRRLPLVNRADLQEIEREWRMEAARGSSALRDSAADAETSSIALLRSSSLSNRVYSSLFQLSFVLRSLSLHYFILVGAQARARAGSGGLAGSAGGPQEQWLLDEELELYLSSLGFLGASPDDTANNAQESEDLPQSDWFAAGSAQSASSFLSASLGPSLRFGSGSSAGGRPMLLLDILSHMHEYLRLVLPASYVAQKLPVGVPEGAQAQRGGASATGNGGTTDGKSGAGSAALMGVTQGYFELATARFFDPQHCAFQYALSDVYSGAVQAGLSSSAAYALTRRCLEWNIVSSVLGCAKAAFESWKQSVEVVLLNSALVLMRADASAFESTLLRMLQTLLSKLAAQPEEDESSSIWVALGEEISSLALTIISTLRDVLRYTSGAGGSVHASNWSDNSRSAQWHAILSLLVSAILSTRHSSTRANLYAVFLQYILLALSRRQGIERAIAAAASIDNGGAATDSDRWSLILAAQVRADAENLALLSSHNRPLLTLVVNDALDGSSKIRGLSYRFLNVLLLGASSVQGAPTNASARDGPSRFFQRDAVSAALPSSFTSSLLTLFGSNNLLLLFLNQLKAHDSGIEAAIHATGARALQGYDLLLNTEAMLGFLLQLSLDPAGASLLQDHQAVRVLSGLGFLHSRPTPSYSNGSADFDGASALPSPLDKFQSLHVLVLELLSSLMQSMPKHAGLLAQVQGFFSASAQQEIVASLVKESYPTITEQSLEALCAALAVLYHGAQAEKANQPIEEEEQRKLQKGVGGARYTPQSRYGAAVQSQSMIPASPAPAMQPFCSFISKHQPALLTLLSRYLRPFSDPRLRSYLTGLVRERQERIDLGESGGGVGEHLSAADASSSADTEATASLSTEVILEQGDIAVQRVFRKVMALISVQLSLPAAAPVVLFGPRLGDGSNLGFGLNGTARVFDRDSDSNGGSSFDPAHPQLELLVSLIDDKYARWKESQAAIGTLRKHLDVIAAAASQGSSDDAATRSASRGGFGMDAASPSSSLASLELEFFPPSASHAWFYQDASPAQRLGHLRVAVLRALRSAQGMRDAHVWSMEHAIMLLYHHVRLYLPSSSLSSRGSSVAQAISPAEFRAQAEGTLVPLLQQIMQAITPQQHTQHYNAERNNRADEQRMAVYGGGGALVLSSATPSLLQSASDNSSVFLTALIQRSLKHITGA